MAQYYGVERSSDYLAHYGVKGMKWRVRKALKKGSIRAYEKQYRKASRHLRRLEKQANNGTKYARKAAIKGLSTAASLGTVAMGITNPGILAYKAGMAGYNAYRATHTKNVAQKAQAFREEMEKTFDPGQLYTGHKRRRRNRA